jgi:bifunctional non-homologous end joining protein LigD
MPRKRPSTGERKPPLKEYRRKRDFARSPEPRPEPATGTSDWNFVVQKHAARRLHYDLRLELDGVLKSWAVTRGPSLTVGEKRLAVRTEDHPKEYLEFEGNIPKGEYGGGAMIIWDRGRWLPEADPRRGLEKGHLAFTLDGTRLKGRWHLVRMRRRRGEKSEPWLLIKSDDAFARHPGDREITDEETTSAQSGRTTEQLAAEEHLRDDHAARVGVEKARKIPLPDIGKIRGARKGLLPTFLQPTLAAPCERPPSGPKWLHEIKYDGYRIQAHIDGLKARLLTRNNLDWTQRFRGIAVALEKLQLGSALLDGEIVVEDANGISSFNSLQADLKAGRQEGFRYYAFDILYCDGFDLTKATLLHRKRLLQEILAGSPPGLPICLGEHLEQDGPTMLTHACRFGLEGIVSKRKDLPYRPGRNDCWLKSKCVQRQEFVILGYVPSTVARGLVGSLPLGYHDGDSLVYAGRVGTGWSLEQAKSLRQDLEQITAPQPRFAKPLPAGAEIGVRWTEPRLVCEIEYRSWTADGLLRAAAFKGLRDDKPASEIVLEERPKRSKSPSAAAVAKIRLTHPERILWELPGVTKQGLADFYTDIADKVLPHIAGRVLSLLRSPLGTSQTGFFAKHPWKGLSDAIRRVDVGESQPMLVVDDLSGLLSLVQADVVEIHPWGSAADRLDRPDRLIFDLDPGEEVPWSAVIEAATEVRGRLEQFGLKSFVKTSGGKGLHVVVPVEPRADWDQAKAFTHAIAQQMTKDRPDRYIATAAKRARQGRIFVDYLRNGRGATAVAAFSTRALPQASVSTPLAWHELSEDIRSDHFKVDNLRQRLDFLKRDPWEGFFTVQQHW